MGQPGYVVGRLTSAFITLFLPSYGSLGPGDLVTVLAVASLLAAVVIARRRPEDRSGIALFAGLATVAAGARSSRSWRKSSSAFAAKRRIGTDGSPPIRS